MAGKRTPALRVWMRGDVHRVADFGRSGERLTASIRLLLFAIVFLIPLKTVVFQHTSKESWVGMFTALGALLFAILFRYLSERNRPLVFLPWLTTQFDVLVVSLAGLGFILTDRWIVVSNSYVHYSIYLLAIFATCLRQNPMLAVAASLSAILQYSALIVFVSRKISPLYSDPDYGRFDWDTQMGRLALMAVTGLLSMLILVRNRNYLSSSIRDNLTGAYNRRFFDEILAQKIALAERTGKPLSLVLLDLDHFKNINDTYGHAVGDTVLREFSTLAGTFFRKSDVFARYGGEEFAMILPDTEKQQMARKLRALQQACTGILENKAVSFSAGIASFPGEGESAEELLLCADRRLYKAKNSGRSRIFTEDEESEQKSEGVV